MHQYKVSGFTSQYTLFQNVWIVEAKTNLDAIEQVAKSFRNNYPEYVVEYARQELRATKVKSERKTD